jgi:3-dehydrosphinganine reductase
VNFERRFRGRHVLITGGSEGIGFALARRLVRCGADVTLVARNRSKLERAREVLASEVPDACVDVIDLDVSDARAVSETFPRVLDGRPLDVLINNAGVSRPGYFWEIPDADFQRIFDVNFAGVVQLTRALLPTLERSRGHVVNVGSLSSVIATLGHSAYCGSKFALYGFSDVLRAELRPRGVAVSIVLPPETETGMVEYERPFLPKGARALQESAGVLTADEVARATLRGVARGDFEIIPGFLARAAVLASRLAPGVVRAYSDWVVRRAT